MRKTPSPLIIHRGQIRKHIPSVGGGTHTTTDTRKSQSTFGYIRAATRRVGGAIYSALFFWKRQVKFKISEAEARRRSHAGESPYSSTRSTSKSSSRTKYPDSQGSSGDTIIQLGAVETSLDEICKATGNFSPANRIGEGAFGTVYRAKLRDGSIVAVKRAKKDKYEQRLSAEFKNEVMTLSTIEHQNLVRFLGYLEHGDERLILVEYVSNGTLREHLDGLRGGLEIAERIEIAIDVAHAITYLHTYTDPPIIHRDIKASNILITERLRAKVTDFGLARLAVEDPGATHISTQVKGTAGYLDPEYLKTYQLTEKSDVYSFGVLLVEMMTGRHPTEPRKSLDERLTIKWLSEHVASQQEIYSQHETSGSALEILLATGATAERLNLFMQAMKKLRDGEAVIAMDPRLRRSPTSNLAVEKVLKLARKCLAPSRQSRPTMRKCAEVLWEIRKELRRSSHAHQASTSYHSGNVIEGGVRKDRQALYGTADTDYHKFNSA